MDKIVFLNNISPDTNIDDIKDYFRQYGPVISIDFVQYHFMSETINLKAAFITFFDKSNAQKALDPSNPPIELNSHLVSIKPASYFDNSPTAILLTNSQHLTKEYVLYHFKQFDLIDVGMIFSKTGTPYYTLHFRTIENRNEAVKQNGKFVYSRSIYSLRPFQYPPQKYPTVSGIKTIIQNANASKSNCINLKHYNQIYHVNPILASHISKTIQKELSKNPQLTEIVLHPIKGDFTPINDLLWNKTIELNGSNYDPMFLYLMGSYLNIEQLLTAVENDYYNMLDFDSAVNGVNMAYQFGVGFAPHIKYIASHIELFFESDILKAMPQEVFIMINQSDYLDDNPYVLDQLKRIAAERKDTEPNNSSLMTMNRDDYINYMSQDSLDLNSIRDKLVELLESKGRNVSNDNEA